MSCARPSQCSRSSSNWRNDPIAGRADLSDAVGEASQQAARSTRLTDELLFLAHVDEPVSDERHLLPMQPIVEEAAADVACEAATRDVRVAMDADPATQAPVAPDALRRAVRNLVANAVRHSPPHATVTARVRTDDGSAVIEVQDEGGGFRRTSSLTPSSASGGRTKPAAPPPAGPGWDSRSCSLSPAHGGTAEARNRPEGGASVSLRLPAQP